MGGQSTGSQTQVSQVQLPKWVNKASQSNYQFAQDIANKPLVQYGGQTVADVSPQTQQAWNLIANSGDVGQEAYGGAELGYAGALARDPTHVTAGLLRDTDLSPYENPFTQDVINRSMTDLQRQNTWQLGQNADKAAAAKAFGGSRGAIVDALTNSEYSKNAGDLSSKLWLENYNQAVQGATGDINRQFQGALSNQQADQAKTQSDISASAGLQGLGDSQVRALLQQYMGLTEAGKGETAQQQALLDEQKGRFEEANNYDLTRLNILLSSLGMSPYGKTQTTTTSGTSGSPDWAQAGLGALSIFAGLSDRSSKTDIEKVGKDLATDLDIYAFRYKGDPKSYPKVVGPMAQDVEKKYPSAVKKIGKKRVVDIRLLNFDDGMKGALSNGL